MPIDTVGGEYLRLKLRYETILDVEFELMDEISYGDPEQRLILEFQVKQLKDQAKEIDTALITYRKYR